MIMPRYGNNLENYFASQSCRLSKISVASLGLSVLNCLEKVHKAGFVYNDLKLDNIMVGFGQKLPDKYVDDDAFLNSDINLIDFGFSTPYINRKTAELLPKKTVSNFRGNMVFAS
jgi:serine/threonine protein kinase